MSFTTHQEAIVILNVIEALQKRVHVVHRLNTHYPDRLHTCIANHLDTSHRWTQSVYGGRQDPR
jgi:hypothetical protein